MRHTRRDVFAVSVSLGLVSPWSLAWAQPTGAALQRALHNPRDLEFLKAAKDPKKQHVGEGPHDDRRKPPAAALDHSWNESRKGMPEGGCSLIIDKEGNWSFSALFRPYRIKAQPCFGGFGAAGNCPQNSPGSIVEQSKLLGSPAGRNGALIFALKSSLGYVMTWEAGGFIGPAGLSWQKQGHDPIVRDLWPDVVKGHKWMGVSVFSPLMLQQNSSGEGGGHHEGNSALGDVASALGTVGAIIAAFF